MLALISISNVLFLILWIGAWKRQSAENFFNPYLARIDLLCKRVTDFLEPVLPWFSARWRALSCLIFLLAFRGFLLFRTPGPEITNQIPLPFGPKQIAPGLFLVKFSTKELAGTLAFSFFSFLLLLFFLAAIRAIYAYFPKRRKVTNIAQLLDTIAGPFTHASPILCTIHVLLFGAVLITAASLFGQAEGIYPGTVKATQAVRLLLAVLGGVAAALDLVYSVLIIMIILSFVGALGGRRGLLVMAGEVIGFLLGPLSKSPIRVGTFDFTPLIFLVMVNIVQSALVQLIVSVTGSLA